MRRFIRYTLAGALLAGAVGAAVGAPPSGAAINACTHPGRIVVIHPEGSFGCVFNHHWMTVCDRHRDGHRVRAIWDSQWQLREFFFTPFAPEGSCTSLGAGNGVSIYSFRVCVQGKGCSRALLRP